MISLWDVLKASKGLPVSDFYAAMWGKQIAGKYTITELEGTLPMSIVSAGEPLMDYRIYGNTVQKSTPTPENPIVPIGCGELETTGAHAGQYKLPILSNSTVTNIYLGEVETTRRIKKLVLTGEENWNYYQESNIWQFHISNARMKGVPKSSALSNIARYGVTADDRAFNNYGCYLVTAGEGVAFQMKGSKDTLTSVNAWKSYLAAQYAAGTPVTVWYVLEEPETGIVNEPLMKIGNYADTLSMEQAGVSIPTNKGGTVIDYDGTLKPSKMYIKYLGGKK